MRCRTVSILTRRLAGQSRNSGSILCRGKRFISSSKSLDQLWVLHSILSNGATISLPGGHVSVVWERHIRSCAKVKNAWTLYLSSPHAFSWRDALFITGTAVLHSLTCHHSCHYWIHQRASFHIYIYIYIIVLSITWSPVKCCDKHTSQQLWSCYVLGEI